MKRAALLLAGALVRWGRDFFCKGKGWILLLPNLQFFLLILVHPPIHRHCVSFWHKSGRFSARFLHLFDFHGISF